MSELFFGYEQEFVKCLSQTQRKVESLVSQPNTKQELAFSDIRLELSEVERQLKFMETESSSMAPHVRPKFHEKVVKYKREYNELRRKITRQEEQYAQEKNKQMLMGARLDVTPTNTQEQQQGAKEKFLKDGQLLSDATYKLKEGVRVIRDTEGISNDVQIELVSHTNRLSKNKEKVLGIHEDLTESQQILTKMAAIMRRNKLVLGVVLGAIILAAIIILSIVLINKNKAAAAAANNGGTGK